MKCHVDVSHFYKTRVHMKYDNRGALHLSYQLQTLSPDCSQYQIKTMLNYFCCHLSAQFDPMILPGYQTSDSASSS